MGRRRSSWSAICLLDKTEERKNGLGQTYTAHIGLCGDARSDRARFTEDKDTVTCQTCKAKLARKALKESTCVEFGESIRDQAWLGYTYRSIWPLKYQGTLVGFATLEQGWGKPWLIRSIEADGNMGHEVGGRYSSCRYDSKEAALLAVPGLIAKGELFTVEDAEAAVAKRREAARLEKEERDRKAAIALQERNERMAALASIGDLPLSNAQRDALAHAYKAVYYATLPMPKVEA